MTEAEYHDWRLKARKALCSCLFKELARYQQARNKVEAFLEAHALGSALADKLRRFGVVSGEATRYNKSKTSKSAVVDLACGLPRILMEFAASVDYLTSCMLKILATSDCADGNKFLQRCKSYFDNANGLPGVEHVGPIVELPHLTSNDWMQFLHVTFQTDYQKGQAREALEDIFYTLVRFLAFVK